MYSIICRCSSRCGCNPRGRVGFERAGERDEPPSLGVQEAPPRRPRSAIARPTPSRHHGDPSHQARCRQEAHQEVQAHAVRPQDLRQGVYLSAKPLQNPCKTLAKPSNPYFGYVWDVSHRSELLFLFLANVEFVVFFSPLLEHRITHSLVSRVWGSWGSRFREL
jgi:hypothetical protein